MAKEKEPTTLESLQAVVDELEWELEQTKYKVSDLESEIKDLKDLIPDDIKDDLDKIFSRLGDIENSI